MTEGKKNLKGFSQIMKSRDTSQCPHCNKEIYISISSMVPIISSIITPDTAKEAKEIVKKFIDGSAFKNPEEKQQRLSWLNDETTIIDPEDVKSFLDDVARNCITTPKLDDIKDKKE